MPNLAQACEHIFDGSKGNSSIANENSAKKHFQNFYTKVYHPQDTAMRENLTLDNIKSHEITDDLVGKFANYLCQVGSLYTHDKGNKILSYTTVSIYMSAIKTLCITKFSNEPNIPRCLTQDLWKRYLSRIRKVKIEQAVKENVPLFSGSYKSAKDVDLTSLAALAYWEGDMELLEFFFLFQSCVTHCGRGSEVSTSYLICQF